MSTVIPAWLDYNNKLNEYDALFHGAIASANDPGFNASDWFNNGGGNPVSYQAVTAK